MYTVWLLWWNDVSARFRATEMRVDSQTYDRLTHMRLVFDDQAECRARADWLNDALAVEGPLTRVIPTGDHGVRFPGRV